MEGKARPGLWAVTHVLEFCAGGCDSLRPPAPIPTRGISSLLTSVGLVVHTQSSRGGALLDPSPSVVRAHSLAPFTLSLPSGGQFYLSSRLGQLGASRTVPQRIRAKGKGCELLAQSISS